LTLRKSRSGCFGHRLAKFVQQSPTIEYQSYALKNQIAARAQGSDREAGLAIGPRPQGSQAAVAPARAAIEPRDALPAPRSLEAVERRRIVGEDPPA
jgi:hypothetical protein